MRIPGKGRLIVSKIEEEKKTSSGIFLADSAERITQKCKIVAIGDCLSSFDFDIDDICYISARSGIDIDNNELVIFEGEILYIEKPK